MNHGFSYSPFTVELGHIGHTCMNVVSSLFTYMQSVSHAWTPSNLAVVTPEVPSSLSRNACPPCNDPSIEMELRDRVIAYARYKVEFAILSSQVSALPASVSPVRSSDKEMQPRRSGCVAPTHLDRTFTPYNTNFSKASRWFLL